MRMTDEPEAITAPEATGLRRLTVLGGVAAVISLAVVLFGSPLFQTLGFEYSGIAALVLSLLAGLDGALGPKPALFSLGLGRALLRACVLFLAPLLISLISLLWLPNCALEDGAKLYGEIALPTALLAAGFGYGFRVLFDRRRNGVITFLIFWLVTFLLSLLPGYTDAQLYTYGWQYGYFPGFVWDRAVELKPAYLAFRLENVLWLVLLLSVVYDLFYRTSGLGRFALTGLALLGTVIIMGSHDNLGITASQSQVREQLRQEAYLGSRTWIYYEAGNLTSQEVTELQQTVPIWLAAIRETFGLRDDGEPIHIYIYPDAPTMDRLVGTRAASIAKPWLGEVHIMKAALGSLKHELTHVVLRTIGNFPFYASWSTGLTEGAAVAVESPDGGLYTTDELAAKILQAHMATGIAPIMQFTGFAAENSQKGYTLAGSFTGYLLRHYGPQRFRSVYSSLNYEKEYHRSLTALEKEWKDSLLVAASPLDSLDLLRLRFWFGAPSIINMPCVRRLGRLERTATIAFEHDNYGDAYRSSYEAYAEGGGASDAWSAARALFLLGRLPDARALLDTVRVAHKDLLLGIPIADFSWIALDTAGSDSATAPRTHYQRLQHVRLGASNFFTAYDRLVLLNSTLAGHFSQYLSLAYRSRVPDYVRSLALLDTMLDEHWESISHADVPIGFDRVLMVLLYIKLRVLEEMGWPNMAAKYDPLAATQPAFSDSLSGDDSLAIAVVERHMWRYRGPSWARGYIPSAYQKAADAELYEQQSVLRRPYRSPNPLPVREPGRGSGR